MSIQSALSPVMGQDDTPTDAFPITGHLTGEQILLPLLTSDRSVITDQLRIAAFIARITDASLYIVYPITVPEQTPMKYRGELTTETDQTVLEWALSHECIASLQTKARYLYTRRPLDSILRRITVHDIDTLVVSNDSTLDRYSQEFTDRLALRANCDVITIHGRNVHRQPPSILLPIVGGPHTGLATDVAQRIAIDCNAWIDILHIIDNDVSERHRQRVESSVEAAYQRIARPEATTTWILEAGDIAETIIEKSSSYELTIIGAPTKGRLRQFLFGSTSKIICNKSQSMVLSIQSN